MLKEYQKTFIDLAIEMKALLFGEFTLKSKRVSPYFFNGGQFNTGLSMAILGQCFYAALKDANAEFDMFFGPAYKGIPLATATAIASGSPIPVAFNRKEEKDHGEGGNLIGAPLKGKVMIIDDVITKGTAKLEAIELIQKQGAQVSGIVIAVDRQERGEGQLSAKQEIEQQFNIPVHTIVTLNDIIQYLKIDPQYENTLQAIQAYHREYGVSPQI